MMYFLRWITGHPILGLVAVTVLYAILNLSGCFGGDDRKASQETQAAADGKADASAQADGSNAGQVAANMATGSVQGQHVGQEAADASATASGGSREVGLIGRLFNRDDSSNAATSTAAAVAGGVAATGAAVTAMIPGSADADHAADANAEKESLFDVFKKDQSGDAEVSADATANVEAEVEAQSASSEPEQVPVAVATQAQSEQAPANKESDLDSAPAKGTQDGLNDMQSSLLSARDAFWRRNFKASSAIYENLVSADPENPDLLGEYGNMLTQAGHMQRAIEVYEKAAHALIDQKRFNEVHPLIGFIGNFQPNVASKLVEKLSAGE